MTSETRLPVVQVSGARIMRDLDAVNRFGATAAGGAQRLAWTDEEVAARRWLMNQCQGLGLVVDQDEAGNVWAHSGQARAIFMRSHLDTVPDGGRFDGALGVVSGLEVLRSAMAAGVPVGMVFVRSQGGISHAPAEFSSQADCEAGARVLARGAIELARRLL